jgi:hypothetical protein
MSYHFPHNLDIWTKNKLFSHFCGLRSPSRSHADVKVILAKISTSNFLLEIQLLPYNLDIRNPILKLFVGFKGNIQGA